MLSKHHNAKKINIYIEIQIKKIATKLRKFDAIIQMVICYFFLVWHFELNLVSHTYPALMPNFCIGFGIYMAHAHLHHIFS